MAKVRVHLDDTTVDIPVDATVNPNKKAELVYSQKSIWVTPTRLYPISRVVFVEVVE